MSDTTCDNGFKATFEEVSNDLEVAMECENLQDHKLHIKRNNETTKN